MRKIITLIIGFILANQAIAATNNTQTTQPDPDTVIAAMRLITNSGGQIRFTNSAGLTAFLHGLGKVGFTYQEPIFGQIYSVSYEGRPVAHATCNANSACTFDPF